mgnify:FL=1
MKKFKYPLLAIALLSLLSINISANPTGGNYRELTRYSFNNDTTFSFICNLDDHKIPGGKRASIILESKKSPHRNFLRINDKRVRFERVNDSLLIADITGLVKGDNLPNILRIKGTNRVKHLKNKCLSILTTSSVSVPISGNRLSIIGQTESSDSVIVEGRSIITGTNGKKFRMITEVCNSDGEIICVVRSDDGVLLKGGDIEIEQHFTLPDGDSYIFTSMIYITPAIERSRGGKTGVMAAEILSDIYRPFITLDKNSGEKVWINPIGILCN